MMYLGNVVLTVLLIVVIYLLFARGGGGGCCGGQGKGREGEDGKPSCCDEPKK